MSLPRQRSGWCRHYQGHHTTRVDALALRRRSLPSGPGEPRGPWERPGPESLVMRAGHLPRGREPGLRATTRPRGKSANPESTEEQVSYRTVCEKSPRCARANMEKREKGEVRCFQGRRSQHRLARSRLGARLRGGVRTFSFPLTMSSAISDDNLALKRLNLNFRRNNLNPQSTVLW